MRKLSLLLRAGAASLEFSFHSLSYDRANTILIFMPRVEGEDKENKGDGQSSRTNKWTNGRTNEQMSS